MTDPPRTRWTDERLDDWYRDYRDMRALAQQVPVIQEQLKGIADDAAVARKNTHELRQDMAVAAAAQADRAATQALERKKDRRWITGALLASGTLVVGAMGVLQGFLG